MSDKQLLLVSKCNHNFESYNGGVRCIKCDDRLTDDEYTEWLEARLAETRRLVQAALLLRNSYLSLPNEYDTAMEALAQHMEDTQ